MIWFLGSVGKASESAIALKHSGNPDREVDRRMEGVSSYRKIQEYFLRLRSKSCHPPAENSVCICKNSGDLS